MSARPFTSAELLTLESHLLAAHRYRDCHARPARGSASDSESLKSSPGRLAAGSDPDRGGGPRGHGNPGAPSREAAGRRNAASVAGVWSLTRRRGERFGTTSPRSTTCPQSSDEYLFKSREGGNRPLHHSQAHRILVQACEECGIDTTRVSTHSLRKTFVRSVYDAYGHDIIRTMKVVQHSSPVIAARYLENTESELDDLVLGLGVTAASAFAAPSDP